MRKATRVAALAAGCLALAGCGGGGGGPDNPIAPGGSSSSSSSAAVGKFLYIANTGDDTISAYSINAATGALTNVQGTPFSTGGTGLRSVVVDPSGKYLYTTNQGGNLANASVSGFAISATTGALLLTPNSPYSLGAFSTTPPDSPIFQPAGNFLFVRKLSETKTYGFSLDKNDGVLTLLAGAPLPTGTFPGRFNTTNSRFYIHTGTGASTAIAVYSVDPVTGASNFLGSTPAGQNSPGFIFFHSNNGYLYSLNFIDKTLAAFAINQTTGLLTSVGPVTPLTGSVFPSAVLVHSSGKFLYVLDQNIVNNIPQGNSSIYTFSIDPTTGILSQVGSPVTTGGQFAIGMSIYPNGNYLLLTNAASPGSVAIFGINQTTGVLTAAVNSPFPTQATSPSVVTIDPSGKYAYLPDRVGGTITQFTVNATAGTITVGNTYMTGMNPLVALIVGSQ